MRLNAKKSILFLLVISYEMEIQEALCKLVLVRIPFLSTVFLRIKGDSLVEFASVELDNDLRVYETDKKGVRKLIREDTATKMYFVRFSNYKPLTPSNNY